LWRSVREKYEQDSAVGAAMLEAQRDPGGAPADASDGADVTQLQATVTMLQQTYAASQEDLRSLAHEYNEAVATLTERAERAEREAARLRLLHVEQLEWIKVLEQRLAQRGGAAAAGDGPRAASAAHHHSAASTPHRHAAAAAPDKGALRARLADFYMRHDRSRIAEVDSVLEQWAGREAELERLMEVDPIVPGGAG